MFKYDLTEEVTCKQRQGGGKGEHLWVSRKGSFKAQGTESTRTRATAGVKEMRLKRREKAGPIEPCGPWRTLAVLAVKIKWKLLKMLSI